MSAGLAMTHYCSLFERLEGPSATQLSSTASVAAHLGRMLSTRAGSVLTLHDYGLPDLNDMRLSRHESLSQSRLAIERFIQAYEPRLANVRVRVLPHERDPLALAFAIDATLMVNGVVQPVVFSGRLDAGGLVEVAPDVL